MIFRNEYFLTDYICKVENYDTDYCKTAFFAEGYSDFRGQLFGKAGEKK